jgi:2,4-dienoyl-CoA reductase-like NADH-dependent reductase (Old Yellow Enzyme family)
VAPSALAMPGQIYVEGGVKKDYEVPKALEVSEIAGIVENFVGAAR